MPASNRRAVRTDEGVAFALSAALDRARKAGASVRVHSTPTGAWRFGPDDDGRHYRVHPSGRVYLCGGDFEISVARVRADGEVGWINVPSWAADVVTELGAIETTRKIADGADHGYSFRLKR